MSENSKIEWTDHTFNPWEGCTKVSPGCLNCYAETRNARWNGGESPNWGKGKPRRRTSESNWKKPLKWNSDASGSFQSFQQVMTSDGEIYRGTIEEIKSLELPMDSIVEAGPARPRVFCASLADWLDDEVPIEWLADLLELIRLTPNLDWLLLTKRPENWLERMLAVESFGRSKSPILALNSAALISSDWRKGYAPSNVWIGTTVEDQKRADERIPLLLNIPAKVRFLSCEPLLEAVDITKIPDQLYSYCEGCDDEKSRVYFNSLTGRQFCDRSCDGGEYIPRIHWVICGGESGSGCRPFDLDWARSLRDQCKDSGVAYFMKQMGGIRKPFPEIPDDLMIREFPKAVTL